MTTTTTTLIDSGETVAERADCLVLRIEERAGCRDLDRVLIERDECLFPESGKAAFMPGLGLRPFHRSGDIDLGSVGDLEGDDLDGLRALDPTLADRIRELIENHLEPERDYDPWREEAEAYYLGTRGV